MQTSEQINELAAALVAVQAEIENVAPQSDAHYGKYASLDDVLTVVRPALTAQGIAVVQSPDMLAEHGLVTVTTRLVHTSGQWIQGTACAPVNKGASSPVQEVGGTITYLRRYALAAMAGVAQADNDGEPGQVRGIGTQPATRLAPQPAPSPLPLATQADIDQAAHHAVAGAVAAQHTAVDEAAVLRELDNLAVDTVANAERIKAAFADGPAAVEKMLRQEMHGAMLGELSRLNADVTSLDASLAARGAKAIPDLTTDQMREAVAAMKAQPAPTEVVT